MKKDKEGKIYQDEVSILNIYTSNARAPTSYKRKFIKAQSTHCTSHNNSGRLQHPTLINGQIIETETKQRQIKTELWTKWI